MTAGLVLRSRLTRALALVSIFCGLTILLIYHETIRELVPEWSAAYGSDGKKRPMIAPDEWCEAFPDPGNVAIALKTGATEAFEKIPTAMLTMLRCAKSVRIYSDMEQNIGGYQLYDALENVTRAVLDENDDFIFYKRLQEARKYGQLSQMLRDFRKPGSDEQAAWVLDKYKQIHILDSLYQAYPDKDWYLMIDADTYLVWPNLLAWLAQIPNPRTVSSYIGSEVVSDEYKFAHGGSGIWLSHAAMHELTVAHTGVAAEWDIRMHNVECCGDAVIAKALMNMSIPLQNAWPTANGERPNTMPFGQKYWCQPVVTMHHISPGDMSTLWEYEVSRLSTSRRNTPMTYADLYKGMIQDTLADTLEDWDNRSFDNDEHKDVETFEQCRKLCQDDVKCFQYSFHDRTCALAYSFHLGDYRRPEQDKKFRSGWLTSRIDHWVRNQWPCQIKFPCVDQKP